MSTVDPDPYEDNDLDLDELLVDDDDEFAEDEDFDYVLPEDDEDE
jgi:hypothetical protein